MAVALVWTLLALALVVAATTTPLATAASTTYVAPDPTVGLSSKNQEYLIGVVSFAVVAVAGVMGVASMVRIDYDDDTLLMVEVPEETHTEEQ
ncbi:hypothetical protein NESM_000496800 [Novymonas esmeraldas]|uniref:Transmembrane protein n=1 Tax=Novymonas esmeraldas TaxID=1808958 RepID=A0AAW0ENG4_9TRYP